MNLVNNFMLLCLTLPWEISLMVRSADQLGLPKIQSFFFFFLKLRPEQQRRQVVEP